MIKYLVGIDGWDVIGYYYADSEDEAIKLAREDMQFHGLLHTIPKEFRSKWSATTEY